MTVRRFGPEITASGTTLRLWAPAAKTVDAMVEGQRHSMTRSEDGWFAVGVDGAAAGSRYRFRIDDELDVPDPASNFQPEDVAGPSQIIDHDAFTWQAESWRGRPWHETVLLECHVGAFSPEGTYRGLIDKLDHVVETGITAIELMPLADFPGRWNWGYDGVLWFAPDHTYGSPDELKQLIDSAHLRNIMVFLDVVYNHFGPEGNYLGRYAPQFFKAAATPWGAAIDYSIPEVRAFAIENAVHWLRDYRFDGLRLDAVHALAEPGGLAMLQELSEAVGVVASESGRHIHLVLENDDNRASLLDPDTEIPSGRYRAQWNDDYHHAWHVLLTGETHGYYSDYASGPQQMIAQMLAQGFAYQGEPSRHRGGKPRGEKVGGLSPAAFVNFLQNHDQIGNRAFGDRLGLSASPIAIEAALAITLLAPMPPLLFMGEDWGARTPFPFFCDFDGALAEAVRQGRRREFAQSYATSAQDVPDPLAPSTFQAAKLDWAARDGEGLARHQLVKALLDVRRTEIVPRLRGASFAHSEFLQSNILTAQWTLGDDQTLALIANLSGEITTRGHAAFHGRSIWGGEAPERLPPWSVFWSIGAGPAPPI
ncbi:malto-oligosyltrehalose trehalohydrolase [Bradyrhizobium sp. LHD-71]|uniref:malto-oligosyltrehalose trehalohydrolase n=1 Tax=Bradyrhizobium sp. LHD-71 TaxID=3072141 RepID=UPI00280D123C|nr:malto-oligosyltrehalose trehalohydrolase [Bradyrhizobium sp. LHD-71]MDQ8727701.1 malto-oligosyltrehalose trehalohydrolase [Bradyrhizobium sp. LHD-71]